MLLPSQRYGFSSNRNRRSKTILKVAAVVLVIGVVGTWIGIRRGKDIIESISGKDTIPVESLSNLWEQQRYEELTEAAEALLETSALDEDGLIYGGFGYFYRAVSHFSLEEQLPLFDRAVVLLRKALAASNSSFDPQIRYILGKAYYHKGKYYADLAIKYLIGALEDGYAGEDTYEYLGLAYSDLGNYEKSAEYFLLAVQQETTDIRLLALAQVYANLEDSAKAEEYLLRTLNKTEDFAIDQKARFMLGHIYLDQGDYTKAEDQYNKILESNPKSADAHYYLGEVFLAWNDEIKARDQWRQAYRLDESHYGARLRLFGGN